MYRAFAWPAFILLSPMTVAAQPAAPTAGTITIDQPSGDLDPQGGAVFRQAVAAALAGVDFTPLPPPGRGRYRAELTVTRTRQGSVTARVPRGQAVPMMGGWGAAVAVPLGRAGTRVTPLIVTQLKVRILNRAGDTEVWAGRALTAQAEGSDADAPATVAEKLADAIAAVFPQRSDQTISVP